MEAIAAELRPGRTLRPRAAKAPKTVLSEQGDESDLTSLEEEAEHITKTPKFRHKTVPRNNKKVPLNKDMEEACSGLVEDLSKGTGPKKRKLEAPAIEDDAASFDEHPSKKKRKRAPKVEPVYVIPEVERKQTTFRGRLGYACLNTILRTKKPADEAVFCSRTCRIDTIKKNGIEWVKDLGRRNVEDALKIIEWNEENNIRFMRLSSEMFPFASHELYGYSLDYCAPVLAKVGALANKYGHRLTVHPGQFTQLGSPKDSVVKASIRELEYHAQMLNLMGIGPDGVMIIHGGGVYGDKEAALARIRKTVEEDLPKNVRDRLVLENDELCYNAADLLPICEELDIPLVFDYHHDMLNPSLDLPPSEIITRANVIFARRGIKPKQHLSEPREGAVTVMERRAHADRCQRLPEDLPDDMDLMIEAKDKEQAVLHLYRIYNLQPVIHASLRPPAVIQTKETKGRKSNRKTRSKKDAVAGEHTLDADAKGLEMGVGIEGDEEDDAGVLQIVISGDFVQRGP
ncbi:UV-endonuclease UvdE-domain-containing protein [Suillus paluster]|uniref:UV-endonuclease UvdE-domain-containing protein n=1 Tax=Suillus paluster TaxID=48578 RepID=UPI001B866F79|nr:UV-endonuclease UvdE-domain-containing protein [Suillus paluster]KAG1751395.1 UV-endonuclease UvdE-domain-containing protein [Suillus paluster]